MTKRILSFLVAAVMTATVTFSFGTVAYADDSVQTVTIFHTNDSHGRVVTGSSVIGMDVIGAIAKAQPDSILVDAGDTFHGLPFATISKGADIVELMNLAGYSVMAPGNHDFNYGYTRLLELAETAKFNVISANVTLNGTTILPANTIKEVGGVKLGFFGLTTPETAFKTNPSNVKDINWGDIYAVANEQVASLKSQGAQVIIALAHIGLDESSEIRTDLIAEKVEGIDIIIDGHSHTTLEDGKLAANNTLIASTGEYESNLGKVTVEFDKTTGAVVSKSATLLSKAECADVAPLAEVKAKIDEILASQDVVLSKVIGRTTVKLDGERETNRTSETNLGNLITDAMRYETGAEIAITNGGGIRATIAEGDITMRDIVTVLPFGNFIVTKYLTGEQIKRVLEHGVSAYPATLGGFPHVSGLTFNFYPVSEVGQKVYDIKVNGEALVPDRKYLVATNDFLAAGGDDFSAYAESPTVNEFGSLEEATAKFIEVLGTINYEKQDRVVAVYPEAMPDTGTTPVTETPVIAPVPVPAAEDKPNPVTGFEQNYGWLLAVSAASAAAFIVVKRKEQKVTK